MAVGDSTAPKAGSSSRPGRGAPREKQVLVAAAEVVGRPLAVWSQKLLDWPKAVIAAYKPESQEHLIRFEDPQAMGVAEKWARLGSTRFQWLQDQPPNAGPNPTWASAPRHDDCVGRRLKVFWPGMGRWYQGKVGPTEGGLLGGTQARLVLGCEAGVAREVAACLPTDMPTANMRDHLAFRLQGCALDLPGGPLAKCQCCKSLLPQASLKVRYKRVPSPLAYHQAPVSSQSPEGANFFLVADPVVRPRQRQALHQVPRRRCPGAAPAP